MQTRRAFLGRLAAAATTIVAARSLEAAGAPVAKPVDVTVYKSPSCGCCAKWVEHLQAFPTLRVATRDTDDMSAIKAQLGVPAALHSCHTAVAGRYVLEGHVPGDLVVKALRERPAFAGLAVPGMPVGSPGMEVGTRKDAYDVVAYSRDGTQRVWAKR